MPKSVPLRSVHESLGATFGEFAGWLVPMRYTSTIEEHMAVRTSVGVFDISHMGRIAIRGPGALELIEVLATKRVSKTREMFMSGPTLILNEIARVRDDEMFYRVNDEEWLSVPNAAVKDKILSLMKQIISDKGLQASVEDLTGEYSMLAVQGPESPAIMEKLAGDEIAGLRPLEFRLNVTVGEAEAFLVSRSGWTGEDGFEIWARHSEASKILRSLVSLGVRPVGIAARDTLRIEMGFVLGGHEYGENPLEYPCALSLRYGLGAIDWKKTGYIGEPALRACRREGVRWLRVGFVMKKKYARFIPRQGYRVLVDDMPVGWVTSGTFSPVRGRGVGMGYVDVRYAIFGEPVTIEAPNGRSGEAKISDFPLIEKK